MGAGEDVVVMCCNDMYRVAAQVTADRAECRFVGCWQTGWQTVDGERGSDVDGGHTRAEACGEAARGSDKYLGG
jgi:hypothetical protein